MRKLYNLKKFLNIYLTEDEELIRTYLESDDLPISKKEIQDLNSLINFLKLEYKEVEGFFLGYKVPNIGHEIDLLKITDDSILNIELKSQSSLEKINEQQQLNYFYLKTLNKNLDIITYNNYEKKFYRYCQENEKSIEISKNEVMNKICDLSKENFIYDIDYLFKPSEFLISPFNDTDKFLEGRYYLTQEQEKVKQDIINHDGLISVIQGGPGTGKSLLLYDIANTLINDFNSLVIHCGLLNQGHQKLIDKGWNIKIPGDDWFYCQKNYERKDYIFIDEAHRFYPNQLTPLLEVARQNNIKIIASIDPQQYIRDNEKDYKNLEEFKKIPNTYYKKIGKKIRSNPEIASFVKFILNLRNKPEYKYENISIEYLTKQDDWASYLRNLRDKGWTFLPFTKSYNNISYHQYSSANHLFNTHRVIGQEFNKVVVILDKSFQYKDDYLGYYGDYYYNPRQMLFQNLTRAREKIKIIIINNKELYKQMKNALNRASEKNEIQIKQFVPKLDNENLKKFYSNILGFELKHNEKNTIGRRKICFQLGETSLSFCEKSKLLEYNKCEIEIVVSNLRNIEDRILKENIYLIETSKNKKSKYITINDPLGNYLKLIEYL
ncbi:DNA/RNA helicase domain-containing protein [Staphylococcus epidermidis]|uniref:DNA/RNA helicase domain-containing protein n=1 Tax=Staphylococcus epidermidis TaxID=1282 RepID=UPI00311E3D11